MSVLQKKLGNLENLEKIGKNTEYIKELSDIALLQSELDQYLEAETNFLICLEHFQNLKDRLGQAAVFGVLGTLYFKKDEYQKSIDDYQNAYVIYKELNQLPEQITCLTGIGTALLKLEQLDEACEIFLDCSALCADNNDIYSLLDCLGNLIIIHENHEKWDVVFELYKKTLEAFNELKDFKGIITTYFNLGILEKRNDNFDEALIYFKQGTNQAIDSNYSELIVKGLGYIGETLFYLGRVNDAKNEFIRALSLSKKIKAKNAITQIRILLSSFGLSLEEIEEELKNYNDKKKNEN